MIFRIHWIVLLVMIGLQLHSLRAAPINLDGLLSSSPFRGPMSPVAVAGDTAAILEFRGVLVDRGETFFSLYEVSSRSSLWVGLNEPGNPYVVQSYDSSTAQVVVQYQGKALALPLKQAKVAALAPVATPNAAANQVLVNAPPGATPAEEAGRLAAVAEEIRRRRALRQQAAQAIAPTPPPRN